MSLQKRRFAGYSPVSHPSHGFKKKKNKLELKLGQTLPSSFPHVEPATTKRVAKSEAEVGFFA
jgi:hypothetical protein